ncbi:microtubule-associated protein tau-like isoform X1 [Trichogramma pretiosum]|uniref:microtubule-associated protein tau-like isoform X1 n=1 Tax=Trichogramma pretiosum TaxID=7493 RepID=UPI0006C9C8D6|nr:microtubule-associated protein tau-like isoform X1 [Trichogramma pretiosum]XP_014233931.1 microtubule-associated protein tau-like isoform X1 [Trichogramma pretiosum]
MEPQQTPQAPSEQQIGMKLMTVTKQGPAAPILGAPQLPQGPRFPNPPSNGPPGQPPGTGPPRFPPDNRAQLLNPSQQPPVPRPPFNGPVPQRAPPPRNVFFGRPPGPPGPPGAAAPPRFPPQPGPPPPPGGGFPAGPRPPVPYGQPGFPPRPPYPAGSEAPRPRPPLQRTESLGADNRPRGAPGPQQPAQTLEGRRARFGPSLSVESVAEVEVHQAQSRPMSAVSEDGTSGGGPEAAKVLAARPPTGKNVERQQSSEEKQCPVPAKNNVNGDHAAANKAEPAKAPATPANNNNEHGIKGFDDGVRKSLTTPPPPLPSVAAAATKEEPKEKKDDDGDDVAQKKKKMTVELDATRDTADDERLSKERGIASAKAVKQTGESKPVKKSPSLQKIQRSDVENDSGVDESTQRREIPRANGLAKKTRDLEKRSMSCSPVKTPNKSLRSPLKTPDGLPTSALDGKKKVPMNKIQVGAAPSPNLKAVRSKIGSLQNATHKPGGGNIKIENKKLDFSGAQARIAAKNDSYAPHGGDKKIQQVKLQWNAKSKIGSLGNTSYKPGGGDKKIESIKLDFKDKAKPKVGSKENTKHVPGGGTVKTPSTSKKSPAEKASPADNIETHKVEVKAESKIGSLDNVKHKPGGGDKKIFDDKTYLRQTSSSHGGSVSGSVGGSGTQSPVPSSRSVDKNGLPISDENLNQER